MEWFLSEQRGNMNISDLDRNLDRIYINEMCPESAPQKGTKGVSRFISGFSSSGDGPRRRSISGRVDQSVLLALFTEITLGNKLTETSLRSCCTNGT